MDMVLRFQSDDPRRRPPNYRSRSIQARIFLLIAGLMILLAMVPDLRVPSDGQWWDFSERPIAGGAPLTDAERSDERVDTRLQREAESPEAAIVLAPNVPNSLAESERESHRDADASPVDRAWQHGWETIYRQLSSPERSTLFAGIRSVRHRDRITEENWLPLLGKLDTLWIDYQMQALQSLAKLPSDEQDAWRQVIDRIAAGLAAQSAGTR